MFTPFLLFMEIDKITNYCYNLDEKKFSEK